MNNAIHLLKQLIPQGMKNILWHLPMAVFAVVWFRFPARKLKVIGITGTNGKTATTQLVTKILQAAGKKVAMASTINFVMDGEEKVNVSKFTTLSSWQLERFLREAVDIGCEYAVIETSSHAIDQYRTSGISYEVAVMTNVTREHLDYHHTMPEYRRAKRRLFLQAKMAVVNLDMENPEEYLEAKPFEKKVSYSTHDPRATLFAEQLKFSLHGSEFTVDGTKFSLVLPGLFNIENALAAIGIGTLLGIDLPTMNQAIAKVAVVPGRMQSVENNRGITIIIDYAVTPDSLEKLYSLVSQMKGAEQKIIALLGACGERDRGKRPMMGEIVSSYADTLILTNEDPYYEDPEQILDDVERGIVKTAGKEYLRIFDRREAIAKALALAESGDIVVITGKGAEETMKIGAQMIPWNDASVVQKELERLS
ncbi:MAG: UDP-N-acetylmuramoyl-L-alanyl-D-glutamate--2,6-diaminopimelate ligase [Candidatus Moraniibacteriota bacterium]